MPTRGWKVFFLTKFLNYFLKKKISFCAFGSGNSENDMRFVFCAVAICFILNNFSYINVAKVKSYIRSSTNFDGGIGQGPTFESHGTFFLNLFVIILRWFNLLCNSQFIYAWQFMGLFSFK